mmetsp:Transcript_11507/g.17418  ORF Transcript_11507/g.17418 Transcript_11507/m.17418 type:complete len:122 (-) Transcript_11507:27-392(-)
MRGKGIANLDLPESAKSTLRMLIRSVWKLALRLRLLVILHSIILLLLLKTTPGPQENLESRKLTKKQIIKSQLTVAVTNTPSFLPSLSSSFPLSLPPNDQLLMTIFNNNNHKPRSLNEWKK